MGWTSTGDPYANVGDSALSFDSEEDAKSFAERHGWEYVVRSILFFLHFLSFFIGLKYQTVFAEYYSISYFGFKITNFDDIWFF